MKKIYYYDPNGVCSQDSGGRIYNSKLINVFADDFLYLLKIIGDRKSWIPFVNLLFFLKYFRLIWEERNSSNSLLVIDISNAVGSLAYLMVAKLYRVRILLVVHHFALNEICPDNLKSLVKNLYCKLVLLASDVIVSPSEYTKSQILIMSSRVQEKIRIINPPIKDFNSTLSASECKRDFKTLVFIGKMHDKRKNLQKMIEVFSCLDPSLKLKLIGDCDSNSGYIKRILSYIEIKLMSNRVSFLGRLSDADLECELRSSTLLLMLSDIEGYGMAAAEAIKLGVPVLAFNRGGLREVVVNNVTGLLFDDDDSHNLSKCIQSLIDDKAKILLMSTQCIERGRSFQTEETFRKELCALEMDLYTAT